MTNNSIMLIKGLFLKNSTLHIVKYPSKSVNITFCLGYQIALPFIKSNGISETMANTNRLMPYFFLLLVFSNPSTSRNAKSGKANLPNITINCNKDISLPATLNQTVLAHGKRKK